MQLKQYPEENIKVPRFEEAAGFYTTAKRSKNMSRIGAKNSKPELALRRSLHAAGLRYRVHNDQLVGRPDLAIKKYRLVVFVDGEFWHGYDWEKRKETIKSNRGFWIPKIERNMQRDRQVNEALEKLGYQVFRFWAAEVLKQPGACVRQVLDYLEQRQRYG